MLTHDKNIRRKKKQYEYYAVQQFEVALFVLATRKDCTGQEMADIFVSALSAMGHIIATTPTPFPIHPKGSSKEDK